MDAEARGADSPAAPVLTTQAPAAWTILRSPRVDNGKASPSLSGPRPISTPRGSCQIAVPSDWRLDNTTDRAQAHSPDGRGQARVVMLWNLMIDGMPICSAQSTRPGHCRRLTS